MKKNFFYAGAYRPSSFRMRMAVSGAASCPGAAETGKTVGENIADAVNKNPEVIRPVDHPYSKTGGLAVLKGNLAPDGSVVKRSAVCDEMMVHALGCDAVVFGPEPCDEQDLDYGIATCFLHQFRIL